MWVVLVLLMVLPYSAFSEVDPTSLPMSSELALQLKHHVDYLAGPELEGRQPGTPGNTAAANYLAQRFREANLNPLPSLDGYGQTISPKLGENLIGVRPPIIPSEHSGWILLGAHFDHLGGDYLGADDNASAIAILLETAKSLPALNR